MSSRILYLTDDEIKAIVTALDLARARADRYACKLSDDRVRELRQRIENHRDQDPSLDLPPWQADDLA
jgi:hypothetical protein